MIVNNCQSALSSWKQPRDPSRQKCGLRRESVDLYTDTCLTRSVHDCQGLFSSSVKVSTKWFKWMCLSRILEIETYIEGQTLKAGLDFLFESRVKCSHRTCLPVKTRNGPAGAMQWCPAIGGIWRELTD